MTALYSTPRDQESRTLGRQVAAVAARLGYDPMGWQDHVYDVTLELEGRLPRYELNVVTVCRQQGKTTGVVAPIIVHRMLHWSETTPQRVVYGAQGVKEARDKWRDEIWPLLVASGYVRLGGLKPTWSLGDAGIRSSATGSVLTLTGMSEAADHGKTVHLAVLDEAWKMESFAREQAVRPSLVAIPDSQLFIFSTAGEYESVYLRRHVELGRRRVKNGKSREAGASYHEWGLDEKADWEDEKLWPAAVPALGTTITLKRLRRLKATMPPDEFRRAHLNQWPLHAGAGAIPVTDWDACRAGPGVAVTGDKLWVAADVPPRGQGGGALAVAGSGVVGIVEKGVGQGWAAAAIRAFRDEHKGRLGGVGFLRGGALAVTGEALEAEGLPVVWYDWAGYSRGCERLYDDLVNHRVAVQADTALDASVRRAEARDRHLGSWVWHPRKKDTSVSVLTAATMAYDLDVRHRTSPRSKIRVSDWDSDEGYDAWLQRYIEEA